jgi:ribosome-associated protein
LATNRETRRTGAYGNEGGGIGGEARDLARPVPARAARPKLRVSHGSGSLATARAATAPVRNPAPFPVPSSPPRARRSARPCPAPSAALSAAAALAIEVARAALDKKATDVEIIDLDGKADYADFLVLMTGGNDRHVRAIADGIEEALGKGRVRPLSVEGAAAGSWMLLDFGSVVAHVFLESARATYDLEGLWLDANRIAVPGLAAGRD